MTEEEIMRAVNTTAKDGTEMEPMAALANAKGVKAEIRLNLTIADLAATLATGQVAIVSMQAWRDEPPAGQPVKPWAQTWDSGHYLTVIGIDDKNVFFVDPSLHGRRGYIPIKEFEERWHDGSIRLGQMQAPAILFAGKPSPVVWEPIL
jgi:predicted double-glycine peptidase